MKIKAAHDVSFFIRSRKKSDAVIRAQITANRKQYEVTTGLYIPADFKQITDGGHTKKKYTYWDEKKQRVNTKYILHKTINDQLDQIANKFSGSLNYYLEKGILPDIIVLRKKYNELVTGKDTYTLIENTDKRFLFWWDDFVIAGQSGKLLIEGKAKDFSRPWMYETSRKYKNAKWHFEKFNQNLKLKEFDIDETLNDFTQYLLKAELNNATIEKVFKCVKFYIKYLISIEILEKSARAKLSTFKLGLKQVTEKQARTINNISLTSIEIQKIVAADIKLESLRKTRDIFLFQIYTGVRYSDLHNLKKENIKKKGTTTYLEFYSIKGEKPIVVPLNPKAISIIKKYEDFKLALLPVPSLQKYNDYIKKVCKLAEINEHIYTVAYKGNKQEKFKGEKYQFITSHVSRKTFINQCFEKNIRPEIIAELVGDSLPVIMKHYRAVRPDDLFGIAHQL